VKDAVQRKEKGRVTFCLTPPPLKSSRRFLGERIAKDVDAVLGSNRAYCFGHSSSILLISGSDPKEHLTFPNYVDHLEWNHLRKH
jgi:hypothetical protein